MLLQSDFHNNFLIKNYYLISGIYDLREVWKNPAIDGDQVLKLTDQDVELLSPVLFKDFSHTYKPSIHILYSENDSPSFKKQSLAFAKHLKQFGFEVLEKEFHDWDHFEIVEELSRKESKITEYILKKNKT